MENTQELYEIVHNRYSGHFMYYGTQVTIEGKTPGGLLVVRSTYGTRDYVTHVHEEEIKKV